MTIVVLNMTSVVSVTTYSVYLKSVVPEKNTLPEGYGTVYVELFLFLKESRTRKAQSQRDLVF